jgi:SAM-dependent methyltransferase
MSQRLADTYTAEWFRARERYRAPYLAFARAIEELWHPRSLVDLGCGAGYILEWFLGLPGVPHPLYDRSGTVPRRAIPVWGVDGSEAVLAVASLDVRPFVAVADLTGPPLPALCLYEFVTCIEVAEHIPPHGARAFMEWFRWADRVFFTAAPPGQRGTAHVNCRPRDEWIGEFEEMGFRHDAAATETWRARARRLTSGCPWVVRNAMFFSRGTVSPTEGGRAP